MKKSQKIIISIVAVFLICTVSICFFCKPIYYRLYLGNRIKGDINIIIDGKPYQYYYMTEFSSIDKAKETTKGTAHIEMKGGEYGSNTFTIRPHNLDKSITVDCFQTNWWYVTNFNLNIDINTHKETISFKGDYTATDSDGRKIGGKIDKTQELDAPIIEIMFGL